MTPEGLEDEVFDRLQELFQLQLGPCARAATRAYIGLLLKWNQAINLTGPMGAAELLERCFFESFWASRALPRGAAIADAGSGAGFPGLAMALYRPDLKATLIEPNLKKTVFLKEVARRLGLGVQVFPGRAEVYPGWEGTAFAVMRALKPSPELLAILRRRRVRLLLLHGRDTAPELGVLRLVGSVLQPGSHDRRLSVFEAGGDVSRETSGDGAQLSAFPIKPS